MKRRNSKIANMVFSFNMQALLLVFFFPLMSYSAVLTVPGDYSTIQAAIGAAGDGDEIVVYPDYYTENINIAGKNIILRSMNPANPDTVAITIIDGNQAGSVVTFSGNEGTTCILSGFTITNGHAASGGGIYGNGTLATIQYNQITVNTAEGSQPNGQGGGLDNCDGTIQNNTISVNSAEYSGGGLYGCDGTIHNNTISTNTVSAIGQASAHGGALSQCHGTIKNNTISANSAGGYSGSGGGLYDCDGTIENNSISGNSSGGMRCYGGGLDRCDGTIENNTISGNTLSGNTSSGGGLSYCNGTIANNTISGNYAAGGYGGSGGGLYDCDGTIENNTISGNTVDGHTCSGGGLSDCNGLIHNNTILGNSSARKGGGLSYCDSPIQNNVISFNVAQEDGGGLYWCNGTIQNNMITSNTANVNGGGLYECNFKIRQNTIYGNSAQGQGGGLYTCAADIRNCIIWGNEALEGSQLYNSTTPFFSCIQDWIDGGVGNITDDPQLVDAANGDFHLRSSSPCIDAGSHILLITQDFEGDPRPYNGTSEPRGDGSDYDIGADEYYPTFHFTQDREGWTSGSVPIVFSVPDFAWEPDYLKIISTTNTNCFGFWQSPQDAVAAEADYLYRVRFNVSTDITAKSVIPQIRLRANSLNLQQYDVLSIESAGDGGASPATSGTDYDLYFVPPSNETAVMLAFDLLNFNPDDAAVAELALDSVIVTRFALDSLSTPTVVQDYTFELSQEGWTAGGAPIVFTSPEYNHSAGALELRAITNTNTFGFWGNHPADITIEADRLYRGTFEIRTDVTNQAQVPEMRLRFNTENFQASHTFGISSAGDGANSPGTTNTTYDRMHFLPPANCVGAGLIVSFDILNFNPADAPTASLILDRAVIETLSPPGLP